MKRRTFAILIVLIVACGLLVFAAYQNEKTSCEDFAELLTKRELKASDYDGYNSRKQDSVKLPAAEYHRNFAHLHEYDDLSHVICRFIGKPIWTSYAGEWFFPIGDESGRYVILLTDSGKASIWERFVPINQADIIVTKP